MKNFFRKHKEAFVFLIIMLVTAIVTFGILFFIASKKGLIKGGLFTKHTEEEIEEEPETEQTTETTSSVYEDCEQIVELCAEITNMANNEELEVSMTDDGAFVYSNDEYMLISVPDNGIYERQVYYYDNGSLIATSYFTAEGSTEFFFKDNALIVWREVAPDGTEIATHVDGNNDPEFQSMGQSVIANASLYQQVAGLGTGEEIPATEPTDESLEFIPD